MGLPNHRADVLIADDDAVSRGLLDLTLSQWGYRVRACDDGPQALGALIQPGGPRLAILDWTMPGLTGPEVCRRLRVTSAGEGIYLILLTAKQKSEDVVEGLASGANDFLSKPFRPDELRARLGVGCRMLDLQDRLAQRVAELEAALAHVDQLQGLLPICAYCHRIRDDANYWQRLEEYIGARSRARFTHGICPTCYEKHVKPQLDDAGGSTSDDQMASAGKKRE